VEGAKTRKGKTPWVMFHWFQLAEFNPDTGVCTMTFDKKLADFLKELKWLYSKINLGDFGRLQSRYALRIFEMAVSYASLQGKDGNESQTWYIERTLKELRKLFGIGPNEYKENREFRRKVIEAPIREINRAGIGVEITTESIKKGRNLAGLRFDCKKAPRTVKKKREKKNAENPPELSDLIDDKARMSREEKEMAHLKELYPDEFAELYAAELAKAPAFIPEGFKRIASESSALMQLKERRGIVK
jgi:plasmid replication initiation protein